MPHSTPEALIPSPGGEVVIATERQQEVYDTWKYAPARRAGDYVYVSGVVIARPPEGPHTPEPSANRRARPSSASAGSWRRSGWASPMS